MSIYFWMLFSYLVSDRYSVVFIQMSCVIIFCVFTFYLLLLALLLFGNGKALFTLGPRAEIHWMPPLFRFLMQLMQPRPVPVPLPDSHSVADLTAGFNITKCWASLWELFVWFGFRLGLWAELLWKQTTVIPA